jgi:hypothetical protein
MEECRYTESHYTECHYLYALYAECHYAECRYAECRAECRGATRTASALSYTKLIIRNDFSVFYTRTFLQNV